MRSKLWVVAGGALGYGAFLGWAITADHYDRRLKANSELFDRVLRRRDREIEGLKDTLMKVQPSEGPYPTEEDLIIEPQAHIAVEIEPETVAKTDPENSPEGYGPETSEEAPSNAREHLRSVIAQYTSDPVDREVLIHRTERVADDEQMPPFVIPRATYAHDPDEGDDYEKITLTYYTRTRTLLDEDENLEEDVDALIGWKNLDKFGYLSEEPDVVFIRNRKLQTDFEVVRDEDDPPIHIRYGMDKLQFESSVAAGHLKLRPEDE